MRAEHVVVPLTADVESERALPAAMTLAKALDAEIRLVSAAPLPDDVPDTEASLGRVAEKVRADGLAVSVAVEVDDDPVGVICAHCSPGDLVVMATSSSVYAGDHYVGSVAEALARKIDRPVVLVGPACDHDAALEVDRVVMALDDSDRARAAIPEAAEWARFLRVTLWLVTVVPAATPDDQRSRTFAALQAVGHRMRSCSLDVEWDVVADDDIAAAIADRAGPRALTVVASRTRTGLDRIAEGSVASDLTRLANRPVVMVGSP